MARYTGPKARVSRRLGTNIWGTKGENIAMEKRPYPPGDHGRTRRRGNVSEYLLQLQEKQKARFTYGMTEKQFRNLYAEANRRQGVTGENLLRFCELRLDNVVYRAGWAATRPQARQFVEPRPRRGQRSPGQHPQLPGPQGRRHPPPRQVAQHGRRPVEHGALRPHAAAVARDRRRRPGGHGPGAPAA